MFQFLYLLAFIVLAVLSIGNLFRNVYTLGLQSRDYHPPISSAYPDDAAQFAPHPELLDEFGNVIDEPLLVMRSVSVEDAREQLDALYHQSPGAKDDA